MMKALIVVSSICIATMGYAAITIQQAKETIESLQAAPHVELKTGAKPVEGKLLKVVCHPDVIEGKQLCAFVIEVDEDDAKKYNTETDLSPPSSTIPRGEKLSYQF